MAKGFKHGAGGGTSLNFKVVGNPQPANPKANTIWVDTDTPITSWVFNATEPGSSDVMALSVISGSPWYLSAPQSLSAGDVLSFEIPENVSNTYEAINIADPTTGDEYFVRNSDGSACNAWVKGTKVSVVLSNDTNKLNGYGGNAKTAYIRSYGSYGMTEGMVWFITGTSSPVEFNALKKNGITVYPLSAMQYINGVLVDKTAKTYQDGAWVDWIIYDYLFKSGTGKVVEFTIKNQSNCTLTVTDEKITVKTSNPLSNSQVVIFTSAKRNTSGKKTLNALIYCDNLAGNIQPKFGLSNSIPNFDSYSYVASVSIKADSLETVYSIDLSGVTSGTYYVGVGGAFNGYIKDIWMEG